MSTAVIKDKTLNLKMNIVEMRNCGTIIDNSYIGQSIINLTPYEETIQNLMVEVKWTLLIMSAMFLPSNWK